jgi:cupin 2 domain-containing protein
MTGSGRASVANTLSSTSHWLGGREQSPEGFWYDQDEAEWVVVLKGEAKLLFEDDHEPITMRPGDHVLIPAHRKHRVEWTTPDEPTVWLAVFYRD